MVKSAITAGSYLWIRNIYSLSSKMILVFGVVLPLFYNLPACTTEVLSDDNTPVWPISGTVNPDFPLSSTYGPRLKASEGFRYDFHRGIDIPASLHSPVYAVADGEVRLAGDYSSYSDTLVQIRHSKSGQTSRTDGEYYYSNYIHLSSAVVEEGQAVSKSQLIGYSGASASGFAHLHFEIRDGEWYQQNAIHPLTVLPYNDSKAPQITINEVNVKNPAHPIVKVTVTSPPDELDLNRVEVFVYNDSGGELVLVDQDTFDMMVWNQSYTPRDTPNVSVDNPKFNGVEIYPTRFNVSSEIYKVGFTFVNLKGVPDANHLVVKAWAEDIRGNFTEAAFP